MNEISSVINKQRIFTILNIDDYEMAKRCGKIAINGGLKLIEVSLLVPDCFKLIDELTKNTSVKIGITGIWKKEDIIRAKKSNVSFMVTLHTKQELIEEGKRQGLFVIGGASTPTEIYNTYKWGADLVNVFPIKPLGGTTYIKLLLDYYPSIELRAQGGLNIHNYVDMLDAGVTAVGLSSSIFDKKTLNRRDFAMFEKKVEVFLGRYNMWESFHSQDERELNSVFGA